MSDINNTQPAIQKSIKKPSRWILRSFLLGLVGGIIGLYLIQPINALLTPLLGVANSELLPFIIAGLPFYLILLIFPSYWKSIRQSDEKIWFVVRSIIYYAVGSIIVTALIGFLLLIAIG
jgi:hypothetical protein